MRTRTLVGALLACVGVRLVAADGILVFDRGLVGKMPAGIVAADTAEFIGDRLQVGSAGETWVVDSLRVWLIRPDGSRDDGPFGRANSRVVLFGGIERAPAAPGQPECDCHDTIELKSASFQPGVEATSSSDVELSAVSRGLLAARFRRLRWSVPGGTPLTFGVFIEGRGGMERWQIAGAPVEGAHELRVLGKAGKLVRMDPRTGTSIAVQAWAYKPATVAVSTTAEAIEVRIHSSNSFDATRIERSSLRGGPLGVGARSVEVAGRDLVARFPREESGVTEKDVTACVTGRLTDGIPFEGCDLLRE